MKPEEQIMSKFASHTYMTKAVKDSINNKEFLHKSTFEEIKQWVEKTHSENLVKQERERLKQTLNAVRIACHGYTNGLKGKHSANYRGDKLSGKRNDANINSVRVFTSKHDSDMRFLSPLNQKRNFLLKEDRSKNYAAMLRYTVLPVIKNNRNKTKLKKVKLSAKTSSCSVIEKKTEKTNEEKLTSVSFDCVLERLSQKTNEDSIFFNHPHHLQQKSLNVEKTISGRHMCYWQSLPLALTGNKYALKTNNNGVRDQQNNSESFQRRKALVIKLPDINDMPNQSDGG